MIILSCWIFLPLQQTLNAFETVQFLTGFKDVPLLEGFIEDKDQSMIYDTPSGTIAQAVIYPEDNKKQTAEIVVVLYKKSLQALGWHCRATEQLICRQSATQLTILPRVEQGYLTAVVIKSHPYKITKAL